MNDTSATVMAMVAAHHQRLTAEERWRVAASMFETARAIVESSLPETLSTQERRRAVARRLYGAELPEAAIAAHAAFSDPD